jgi:multiple sugar transport system substrate-binding protein
MTSSIHKAETKSRRRALVKMATLAAGASTLVAVMGLPAITASAAPAATTTVNWWASPIVSSLPDPRVVLITAFEKANPTIKVNLENAPADTDTNRATLVTQISGGGGPDVFMGDVIWPAQFASKQLALPLSSKLPASYFATFAKGLVAGASYKGQVYGAPFFEDQGFLYYRKDLLTKAHLAVPTTWQQLESEAKQLQKAGSVKYGFVWQGADYEGATCDFMEYLTDAGGKVLNAADTKSALDSPAAIKALTFMRSLVTSGVSPAATNTFQEAQSMAAFQNGQAAFLRNWDYAYSTANAKGSKVIGDVGVAPLPTFAGQKYPGYSNIGGWNLYVNPNSKNIPADLTFIKWMTGNAAQTILATQFSEIPTNQAVRQSPKVEKANPVFAIVPKTLLVPRPAQTPNYPAVSQAIYQNVSAALGGSASPSSAISSASSQINTALGGNGL